MTGGVIRCVNPMFAPQRWLGNHNTLGPSCNDNTERLKSLVLVPTELLGSINLLMSNRDLSLPTV